FELPGPPGKRFDYLTIDEDDHYLLSAHLAAGLLHVIDLRSNAVVKTIPDVPGVEGVRTSPRAGRSAPRTGERTRSASSISSAWPSSRSFRRKPSPTASPTPRRFTKPTGRTSAPRPRASSTSGPIPS